MSQLPFSTSALRGAIDLSALKRPAPPAGGPAGAARGAATGPDATAGLVVEATDAGFEQVVSASLKVPAIIVLWSPRDQVSMDFVDVMAGIARANGGAFRLVTVDVDRNPGVLRAFQAQAVPMTIGLVQGQPVPLFEDAVLPQQIQPVVDQLLALAAQHGVTGRVDGADESAAGESAAGPVEPAEAPLPPLHQAAYDAIDAGDLEAAVTAYGQALKENPADAEAKVGLSQVRLMQRTEGVDLAAARAAAATGPTDVDAQLVVADLDVLGGHVEDAFVRLIDLVRVTADAERNRVRERLLELFDIVGPADERVAKARKALMSALF